MTADSIDSGTNDLCQARPQPRAREPTFFQVPALAAVAARRIARGVQAVQGFGNHARRQQRVAERLAQAAGSVVLFDGDDPALLLDARRKLGGDRLEREGPHTPDLELVEQRRSIQLVESLDDGANADDDTAATGFELAPRRERRNLSWNFGRQSEPQIVG